MSGLALCLIDLKVRNPALKIDGTRGHCIVRSLIRNLNPIGHITDLDGGRTDGNTGEHNGRRSRRSIYLFGFFSVDSYSTPAPITLTNFMNVAIGSRTVRVTSCDKVTIIVVVAKIGAFPFSIYRIIIIANFKEVVCLCPTGMGTGKCTIGDFRRSISVLSRFRCTILSGYSHSRDRLIFRVIHTPKVSPTHGLLMRIANYNCNIHGFRVSDIRLRSRCFLELIRIVLRQCRYQLFDIRGVSVCITIPRLIAPESQHTANGSHAGTIRYICNFYFVNARCSRGIGVVFICIT